MENNEELKNEIMENGEVEETTAIATVQDFSGLNKSTNTKSVRYE